MGEVERLSPEREIAIVERIEAGRDQVLKAIYEFPFTPVAIAIWYGEWIARRIGKSPDKKVILNDIVDIGPLQDALKKAQIPIKQAAVQKTEIESSRDEDDDNGAGEEVKDGGG